MRNKTHKEFEEQLFSVNKNIKLLDIYTNSQTLIKCKCLICNHEWMAQSGQLLRGHGCAKCKNVSKKTNNTFISEMYDINPEIEILSNYINASTKIKLRCKKDGYIWYSRPTDLLNNKGCPKCAKNIKLTTESFVKNMDDINSNIHIIGKYNNNKTKIECECKICSKHWYAVPNALLRGSGCPYCKISKGEQIIKSYLEYNNFNYMYEYKFSDLFGVNGGLLSYDFFIPKLYLLIEYQGKQHFEPLDFFGGEERFLLQQEHDERKREYAKTHNIKLLEISYNDIDNLETILNKNILDI